MGDINKMIAYAKSKWHRVKYDMGEKRLGPSHLDCSSFVFYCLIAGEFLPNDTRIGNTEDLFRLNGKIFEEIFSYDQLQKGDIFIRGYEGRSGGRYGHTGIFLKKDEIIHCNALNDTVTINNLNSFIDYYLDRKRSDFERYFRPISLAINNNIKKIKDENWRGRTCAAVNVRKEARTSSEIICVYPKNSIIYYDSVYEADGYRWISYIGRDSGKRRFVAYREIGGKQWIDFSWLI